MQRGWDCLARFGERLAGFKKHQVRAVATQTLREARNREEFLARAHKILGFPIDVIPGREEARLIYQGVAHLLPQSDERRLVVDIGGRSTEMILGKGLDARTMNSDCTRIAFREAVTSKRVSDFAFPSKFGSWTSSTSPSAMSLRRVQPSSIVVPSPRSGIAAIVSLNHLPCAENMSSHLS